MIRPWVTVCAALVVVGGCGSKEDQAQSASLRFKMLNNGSGEYCTDGATCEALSSGPDCAYVEISYDAASGQTCENCFTAQGIARPPVCQGVIACAVVTIPNPDCVVCAHVNGPIVHSTCTQPPPQCAGDAGCPCESDADCEDGYSCEVPRCDGPQPSVCGGVPRCEPTHPSCHDDADCPTGEVCEPGPGCQSDHTCVPGCHNDAQCGEGQSCQQTIVCVTCPCPAQCVETTAETVTILGATRSFGECLGECITELALEGDAVTLTKSPHDPNVPARQVATGRLRPFAKEAVEALEFGLQYVQLQERYGCPDCADGGAMTLHLQRGTQTSAHIYEYRNPPAVLAPIDALLESVFRGLESCSENRVVVPDPGCEPNVEF